MIRYPIIFEKDLKAGDIICTKSCTYYVMSEKLYNENSEDDIFLGEVRILEIISSDVGYTILYDYKNKRYPFVFDGYYLNDK